MEGQVELEPWNIYEHESTPAVLSIRISFHVNNAASPGYDGLLVHHNRKMKGEEALMPNQPRQKKKQPNECGVVSCSADPHPQKKADPVAIVLRCSPTIKFSAIVCLCANVCCCGGAIPIDEPLDHFFFPWINALLSTGHSMNKRRTKVRA